MTIGANPILANTLFGLGSMRCALESDLFGGYEKCVEEAFESVHLRAELKSLYTDSTLLADPTLGYLKVLGESLSTAKPRPVTPFYPGVTAAIEENAYAALKGDKSVDQALKDMQAAITSATGGH